MIPGKFAEIIPAYVINALENALQIHPEDRTEDVELLRDDLSASPTAAVSAAEGYSSMAAVRRSVREEPQRIEDDTEDYYEDDYIPQKSGTKKSTIITLVVSVVVCLAVLLAVIIGIVGVGGNGDEDNTTTPNETVSDSVNETEEQFINVTVPDFRGKNIDEVKADENYKDVLSISTVYEDSDQEIGTVIAQDLPEGTVVSSINKRSITLKVSDGLKVPDLVGEDATEARKQLVDKGFKDVEVKVSSIAETTEDSNKVTDIVYYPKDETEWKAIPDDRRISATLKVVIYCYGEYTPPETEATTQSIGENIDSIIEGVEGLGNIINEF
jgi:hypothetical protein